MVPVLSHQGCFRVYHNSFLYIKLLTIKFPSSFMKSWLPCLPLVLLGVTTSEVLTSQCLWPPPSGFISFLHPSHLLLYGKPNSWKSKLLCAQISISLQHQICNIVATWGQDSVTVFLTCFLRKSKVYCQAAKPQKKGEVKSKMWPRIFIIMPGLVHRIIILANSIVRGNSSVLLKR